MSSVESVYAPAEDSFLLGECIAKENLAGMKCLDLGCGSGIQSIAMLKAGAGEVLAVDVNEDALSETQKNIKDFFKEIENTNPLNVGQIFGVRKSDLFSNVPEKFDFIAFNPPYVPSDGVKWRDLDGGKRGRVVIDRFISEVMPHLAPHGAVLLLLSSLNGVEEVEKKLNKSGFLVRIAGRKKIFFEGLVVLRAGLK